MNFFAEETWQAILNGDPAAWEHLVLSFSPMVLTVIRRTGLGHHDCDDCLQQTWLALFQARKRIKQPEKIGAWLCRTAYHKAMKLLRRKAVAARSDSHADLLTPDPIPDHQLLAQERQAMLRMALFQLDERCQRLLTAVFFGPDSLSYKEIAEQLDIPLNSFGPTRSRCLSKLRKILKEIEFE